MKRKTPSDPTFHPSRDEAHWAGDETASGQQVLFDLGEDPARMRLFGTRGSGSDLGNQSRLVPQEHGNKDNVILLDDQIKQLGKTKVPTSHWGRNRPDVNLANEGMPGAGGYYRPSRAGAPPQIGVMAGRWQAESTLVHEMGHAHHFETVPKETEQGNPTRRYRDKRGYQPDPLQEAMADAYVDRFGGYSLSEAKQDDFSHISSGQFGYSSRYEEDEPKGGVWNDPDRVLYAGSRAHFSETGEHPRYQPGPGRMKAEGSSTDATIAMLHEHSPHARAAWQQLTVKGRTDPVIDESGYKPAEDIEVPMSDLADKAVRRHMDRQLLDMDSHVIRPGTSRERTVTSGGQQVQGAMFLEMKGVDSGITHGYIQAPDAMASGTPFKERVTGLTEESNRLEEQHGEFIWPEHMSKNQFGETPRTMDDVRASLGPREADYWSLKAKGIPG
jgi:hypothetical protein